ncbi:MAG: type II secretion system protein N [Betaproteobacteria bacterium]|nr:type II secretion system protein N [Betaproteobacteria bacterium]
MRRWSLFATGLGIYAAALVIQAPATLVDAGLQQASNGRLRLAQAQGTIWAGAGQLEIRDLGSRNAIAKDIAWRVLLESLWRGRLVSEVELDRAARRFPITATLSKFEIANADINLPAAALAFAEPRLKPLRLSGDVLLHTTNLSIGRDGLLGNVTLQWRAAGSAFSPVSPIGSYELRLDGQGNTVHALLSTLQGPLRLDGSGSWANGGNAAFQATVRVPPQYREQLTPLLRMISVQRDEGSFELQFK